MEGYLGILPFFMTRSESSMIGKFLLWLQELIKRRIKPAPQLTAGDKREIMEG
jgi:hypothetical protein